MARIVVLTTLDPGPAVLREVTGADDEVHVVVPAVEQSRLQWLANEEDEARAEAARIGRAVEDNAETLTTSSEHTPDAPGQALADAIREHRPDRVVVLLRAGDDAPWLEKGELARTPGMFEGVPVERLVLPD